MSTCRIKQHSPCEDCKCTVFKVKIYQMLKNKHKCSFFLQLISVTYSWDIYQFNLKKSFELELEKHWDYLTGLVLTLWYIGFKKIRGLPYWIRNDFICWNWLWKILELLYWIWIILLDLFMIYWTWTWETLSARTTSPDLDWI